MNNFRIKKGNLFQYIVCAYIVFSVGRMQELFPFLSKLYLMKILGALSVVVVLMNLHKLKESLKTPQFKAILGITFIGIFTIPFSVWPGNSVNFIIDYYWKTILVFLVLVSLVTSIKDMNKFVWALLIAVGFLSALSIIANMQGVKFAADRVFVSSTYDPNDLALVMVIAFPFAVFGVLTQKGIVKIILGGLTALIVMTIILTVSRGGFLGFLGVSLFIIIGVRKYFKKAMAPLIIIIVLVSGILIYYAGNSSFWERMSTILTYKQDYNVTSYSGRIEVWKRGLTLMSQKPFWGVGINGFVTAEGLSHQDIRGKWSTAHNSFIQIGAELGIIGLFLFCYLIWSSFKGINKIIKDTNYRNRDKNSLFTLVALRCSWVGYIIGGFFLSVAYAPILFFLAGLSAVVSSPNYAHPNEVSFVD
jgi:O-antigen ligase